MRRNEEGVIEAIKDLAAPYLRKQINETTALEDLDIQYVDLNCAIAGGIGVIVSEKDFEMFRTVGDVIEFCLRQ